MSSSTHWRSGGHADEITHQLAAIAALFSSAFACTGSGDTDSGDDYSVEGALAELPASVGSDAPLIQTADLDAATELSGLERPTDLDPETVSDWISPLVGVRMPDSPPAPVFVPVPAVVNPRELIRIDEFDEELGWSLLDVDTFVEQSTPPETFAVVTGAFDSDQLNPDLAPASDAVVSAGEGDDLEPDLDETLAARPLGVPLRMAQDEGRIAASPSTPFVEDWTAGPDETLADNESLASVAAALDDADAVAAVLTSGLPVAGVAMRQPEQLSTVAEQLPADPFDTVGIGWGVDDNGAAAPSMSPTTSPRTTPPRRTSTPSRRSTPTASACKPRHPSANG